MNATRHPAPHTTTQTHAYTTALVGVPFYELTMRTANHTEADVFQTIRGATLSFPIVKIADGRKHRSNIQHKLAHVPILDLIQKHEHNTSIFRQIHGFWFRNPARRNARGDWIIVWPAQSNCMTRSNAHRPYNTLRHICYVVTQMSNNWGTYVRANRRLQLQHPPQLANIVTSLVQSKNVKPTQTERVSNSNTKPLHYVQSITARQDHAKHVAAIQPYIRTRTDTHDTTISNNRNANRGTTAHYTHAPYFDRVWLISWLATTTPNTQMW